MRWWKNDQTWHGNTYGEGSFVIKIGSSIWYNHIEHKDDADWVKRWTLRRVESNLVDVG